MKNLNIMGEAFEQNLTTPGDDTLFSNLLEMVVIHLGTQSSDLVPKMAIEFAKFKSEKIDVEAYKEYLLVRKEVATTRVQQINFAVTSDLSDKSKDVLHKVLDIGINYFKAKQAP